MKAIDVNDYSVAGYPSNYNYVQPIVTTTLTQVDNKYSTSAVQESQSISDKNSLYDFMFLATRLDLTRCSKFLALIV